MMVPYLEYTVFLAAYLSGTIPFAFLIGKYKKIDVRNHGSGNIGATNALRVLGKRAGATVMVCDILKGTLAAYLCSLFFGPWGGLTGGLLAMAGHSWNPFFGFKPSGKGVATGCGALIILMPEVMLISGTVFFVVTMVSRMVSLASILGSATALIMSMVFPEPLPFRLFTLIGASLVFVRHRANIKRIIDGTESRIGCNKEKE
ncbi:acyl-phosphate glycerol-3-phosphate acyltransferase [Syntrophobotulus glycolicus DSM 8271]|uniref:Glycerol-3-phosphate acyltransferase n=1 Tax=Syntrophobotulus glycolicus (strain DSM 8271 / FlGlyR) TaxID=645991 RepID=F0SYV6_SYNGF|nr:acyl-phosphate glycerol-3-phosphate acyltransferase [Syntrophobotulus glycolicus DSM 8271]